MTAFKVKAKESKEAELTAFPGQVAGKSVEIQAVYYSSLTPGKHLMLYDADGDCFMYPIPGQVDQKVVTPEVPVTVKTPIYYLDEVGDNEIIVFGKME